MNADVPPAGQFEKISRGRSFGKPAMAAGVLALGLFYLYGGWAIAVLPTYALIGPRVFPYIVAFGLMASGLLLFRQELSSARADGEEGGAGQPVEDWAAVTWVAAGLVINVAAVEWTGYIIATTLLFVLAARGLGSRRYLTSASSGFVLALATYLAFTRLLELHLPSGWLGAILS